MIAFAVSLVVIAGCNEPKGADVDFLVPPNLKGLIVVIEDKKNGEEVDPQAPVFFNPTNGVLRLKTLAPFEKWHHLNAQYFPGGYRIPEGHYNDSPDDDVVRLFALSSTPNKTFYWLGTHREARNVYGKIGVIDLQIR